MSSRANTTKTATIANAATQSSAVWVESFQGGSFEIPASFGEVSVTIEGSIDTGSGFNTWSTIKDNSQTAVPAISVSSTLAGVYPLPDEIKNYQAIRFVTPTTVGAEKTINVFLKS